MADSESRSIPQLLGDFTSDLTALVRKEAELVRSEFSEKVHDVAKAGGEMAAGAICLLAALLILLQALVIALAKYMDPALASLLVGVVVALAGLFLLRTGGKTAKPSNLAPDRSLRQMEKDTQLAKEQVK
ncbi:MAG: phage holin family protein [Deltaproteobacteria bacterium]|nr:phage holin family protein [Deltaproteobacteria bacterium]